MPHPVWDASDWRVDRPEPTGDDEKVWIESPPASPGERGELWLFKPRTEHQFNVEGQDWAEKVAAEIANTVGVPAARVELAQRGDQYGHICLNLTPPSWELQPGMLLLSQGNPNYHPGWERVPGRPGHSLTAINHALSEYGVPRTEKNPIELSAFDVFCGYLVLDALIANQDRHDQNWAVLLPPSETLSPVLCESFDHGSSLGCNNSDVRREAIRASPGGIEAWAKRGSALKLEHAPKQPLSLVETVNQALSLATPSARGFWKERIEALDVSYVTDVLSEVPGLSGVAVSFTSDLIAINRRRLLDEC